MAKPIVALLSDFGTRDHYTGVMKGVVLSICPDAVLVDVSHDLPAHDIPFAALELAATYKYFPAGTIFVVGLLMVVCGVCQKRPPEPRKPWGRDDESHRGL